MTIQNQVYKCNVCGNIVEVLHAGGGTLVCCGQPMELLQEKTKDVGLEKHQPVISAENGTIKVKVGSIPHPMEEKHFIEWIEVVAGGRTYRKFLKPGNQPAAEFKIEEEAAKVRAYCNVHGLWQA